MMMLDALAQALPMLAGIVACRWIADLNLRRRPHR